ncbi:hypothetical protein CpB0246 [Chlamydia pneumoniae TW-183]|uniref:Inclusion membrane protein n=3 Tax=Chlamydia pneumoniae TaxID=83558 RepID=A0ABN3YPQ9_CHLPN|nr:hypothetical protein CP_0522 [Chlamydia pneumoniae AR39]AAP98179.1 hypothetical protein CpB0246 [Chlamydia pneumoniae TW-183]BAA98450.1 hypothetical protein [Chlamydia pneumoniae J138]
MVYFMVFSPSSESVVKANSVVRSNFCYFLENKFVSPSESTEVMFSEIMKGRVPDIESLFDRPTDMMMTGFKAAQNLGNLFNSFGILIMCFSQCKSCQTPEKETSAIVLGATLLFFVIALILGPTLGALVYCAYKVYTLGKMIYSLNKAKAKVLRHPAQNVFHRAAGVATIRSSEEAVKACKLYKSAMIGSLVVSLIASLALIALTAGIVLVLFFVAPGAAPVITAAMMGCCAAGGGALLISLLGLWIAIVRKAKHQEACVGHLTNVVLHTAVSEALLHDPSHFQTNALARDLFLTDCLSHYGHLFSNEEVAQLVQGGAPGGGSRPSQHYGGSSDYQNRRGGNGNFGGSHFGGGGGFAGSHFGAGYPTAPTMPSAPPPFPPPAYDTIYG